MHKSKISADLRVALARQSVSLQARIDGQIGNDVAARPTLNGDSRGLGLNSGCRNNNSSHFDKPRNRFGLKICNHLSVGYKQMQLIENTLTYLEITNVGRIGSRRQQHLDVLHLLLVLGTRRRNFIGHFTGGIFEDGQILGGLLV